MGDSTSHGPALWIDRAVTEYIIPRDHPSPQKLTSSLSPVLSRFVPTALERSLAGWFSKEGDGLWFIQKLECEADLDADHDPEILARRWSTQIARSLARTIEQGSSSHGVLFFPNPAAFLAQFLEDLVKGQAWNLWYYRQFQGLKMLPVEAALRTAVLDEHHQGQSALLSLPEAERIRVLSTFTGGEARRVLETFASRSPEGHGKNKNLLEAIRAVLPMYRQSWYGGDDRVWQGALDLYLRVVACDQTFGGYSLQKLAVALVSLEGELVGKSGSTIERMFSALRKGSPADLYQVVGTQKGEHMLALLQCSQSEREGIIQESKKQSIGDDTIRFTPFGGLFLLMPLLDRLPLEKAVKGWTKLPEEGETANGLRLLILTKCLGCERMVQAFHDPLIRGLLHIPPKLTFKEAWEWTKQIKPAQWRQLQQVLAEFRLKEWAESPVLELVFFQGQKLAILLESPRDLWLAAKPFKNLPSRACINFLKSLLPPKTDVHSLVRDARVRARDPQFRERFQKDLAFLNGFKIFGRNTIADWCITVAAQSVLRDFANRLPGFANSSLGYLFANFLDISARMEEAPNRRMVTLSRPSLNVILNMTGLMRTQCLLGWLPGSPIEIFPET